MDIVGMGLDSPTARGDAVRKLHAVLIVHPDRLVLLLTIK